MFSNFIRIRKGFKCHCGKSYKTAHGLKSHALSAHNAENTQQANINNTNNQQQNVGNSCNTGIRNTSSPSQSLDSLSPSSISNMSSGASSCQGGVLNVGTGNGTPLTTSPINNTGVQQQQVPISLMTSINSNVNNSAVQQQQHVLNLGTENVNGAVPLVGAGQTAGGIAAFNNAGNVNSFVRSTINLVTLKATNSNNSITGCNNNNNFNSSIITNTMAKTVPSSNTTATNLLAASAAANKILKIATAAAAAANNNNMHSNCSSHSNSGNNGNSNSSSIGSSTNNNPLEQQLQLHQHQQQQLLSNNNNASGLLQKLQATPSNMNLQTHATQMNTSTKIALPNLVNLGILTPATSPTKTNQQQQQTFSNAFCNLNTTIQQHPQQHIKSLVQAAAGAVGQTNGNGTSAIAQTNKGNILIVEQQQLQQHNTTHIPLTPLSPPKSATATIGVVTNILNASLQQHNKKVAHLQQHPYHHHTQQHNLQQQQLHLQQQHTTNLVSGVHLPQITNNSNSQSGCSISKHQLHQQAEQQHITAATTPPLSNSNSPTSTTRLVGVGPSSANVSGIGIGDILSNGSAPDFVALSVPAEGDVEVVSEDT